MIDMTTESPMSLADAAKLDFLRVGGKKPHFSTVWRWATRGAKASDGTWVRLETVKYPAGRRTSREAVERFIRRLTGESAPPSASPRQRKKSSERADAELAASGW